MCSAPLTRFCQPAPWHSFVTRHPWHSFATRHPETVLPHGTLDTVLPKCEINLLSYLKCAVPDITLHQVTSMNAVMEFKCGMMCGRETALLAQKFLDGCVYDLMCGKCVFPFESFTASLTNKRRLGRVLWQVFFPFFASGETHIAKNAKIGIFGIGRVLS